MELLNPLSSVSNAQTAFTIYPGKQITLHAKGLAGGDKVFVEILELSKAPDFTGNPCCTFYRTDIQVVARTPLLCPDGRPTELTAEYPVGTMDSPQSVTLGVRVEADDAAVVSIELYETDSEGCMSCICDRPPVPCEDTTWTNTGEERCVGDDVESLQESNCGNKRWEVVRAQTWTPTGAERCKGAKVEIEEENDCGKKRWTEDRDQTWTPTGEKRCVNNLVENQEANDCGDLRWTATAIGCGYCPSLRLSCDGKQAGFGFHLLDPKDPAATVEMAPCAGDASVDTIYIYPTAGPGHTVKVTDCDGVLIGYAVNRSDCAPECPCGEPEIKVNVVNKFAPTTNVAAPEVTNNFAPTTNVAAPEVTAVNNITLPAPNVVAAAFDQDGELTITRSDATTITAQIPTCE